MDRYHSYTYLILNKVLFCTQHYCGQDYNDQPQILGNFSIRFSLLEKLLCWLCWYFEQKLGNNPPSFDVNFPTFDHAPNGLPKFFGIRMHPKDDFKKENERTKNGCSTPLGALTIDKTSEVYMRKNALSDQISDVLQKKSFYTAINKALQ